MNKPSRPRAGFFFADTARIALALAALLVAVPFLFPEHRPPIASFYDEWFAAALATLAVLALLVLRRASEGALPELSLWLALFAAWLALQAAVRQPAYPQLPAAGVAYVLLAAQLAWLGRALAERFGAERVADLLALAILATALANAAIGIMQFYGVPRALGALIATSAEPRIVGHVGQANLFTDYLALGQASALYLAARGRLGRGAWWAAAGLLALASGYVQSRSAILFSLWLWLLTYFMPQLARRAGIVALATLAAIWALPLVHEALDLRAVERFARISTEPRLVLWALAWRLFAAAPWLGVGWGEFAGAAFAAGLPAELAAAGTVWRSAHNIVLQVLAEAGAPGAALLVAAALRWWIAAWSRRRSTPALPSWWTAAIVGTLCLHALLEEPLAYAHFLALAALVAGIGSHINMKLPLLPLRFGLLALSLAACGMLAWSLFDYQRFERAYVIATGRTLAAPREVAAALEDLRAAARGPLGAYVGPWLYQSLPLDAEDTATMPAAGERAMRRWPSHQVIARYRSLSAR